MIRKFLKMMMYVVVAQWLYAETALIIPSAVPLVNKTLKQIQIPTHDKWPSMPKVERFLQSMQREFKDVRAGISAKLKVRQSIAFLSNVTGNGLQGSSKLLSDSQQKLQ